MRAVNRPSAPTPGRPCLPPVHRVIRIGGFAVFVAALAICAWWWTSRAAHGEPAGGVPAAAFDTALFICFAAHHSVCARPWAKQLIERVVPASLVRSAYVWIASLLLVVVCVAWQPIGGVFYTATGVPLALLRSVQLLGLVVGILTIRRTSVGELSGGWTPVQPARLEATGPYRVVRHPLYSSLILLLFGTAHMTSDRALFTVLSVCFIVLAMPFEEAGLVRQFGDTYAVYRSGVRWRLIPYIH